jgi:hypothetical protein
MNSNYGESLLEKILPLMKELLFLKEQLQIIKRKNI